MYEALMNSEEGARLAPRIIGAPVVDRVTVGLPRDERGAIATPKPPEQRGTTPVGRIPLETSIGSVGVRLLAAREIQL